MSMTRACLMSFALLAIGVMGFQPPTVMSPDPINVGEDVSGRVDLGSNGGYFRVNHVVGNGMGWNDGGFTTIGGWLPFSEFGADTVWYSDLRVFVTNDGYVGQNAGIGVRRYNDDRDRFFGGAVFYDHDYGSQHNGFGQITTSLETIGELWDARVNGYFPVANETRLLNGVGGSIDPDPFFRDNRIFFPGTGVFLEALRGVDAEVGAPFVRDAQWLRGYVGGYAYNSESQKEVNGFRGRLEAQLSDDLSVQGMVTDDRTFGTLVNLVVDVRLGGGRPNRAFANLSTRERMYLPVQRNWRISTNTFKAPIEAVARDVNDHHKLEVVWVDSAANPGGDGTFENPFQTLAGAETVPTADFVLVRRGDGTTYDGGITLQDNQRFLGEGRAHQFDAYAAFGKSTLQGTFTLPGFTDDPSLVPSITNTAGNAVTLANNNEVSSFNIDAPTGFGITGSGITDFNLNHLSIDGAGLGGIVLNNANGTGLINNVALTNNLGPAVQISNVNSNPLLLDINTVTATNNVQALSISADNSTILTSINGYLADANQSGLELTSSNGGSLTAQVVNSDFTNSTSGDGVRLTAVNANSDLTLLMDNTDASGNFGNGLLVDSSDQAQIAATITNSSFDNSGLDGLRVLADNSSTGNVLDLTDTTAFNAGVDGLHSEITNNSEFTIDITNGNLASAGQDAVDTLVDGSSTLNLTIDPTPADHAGANGFRFQVANNSTLNANLLDTDMSFATENGVLGAIDQNSTANLFLSNSPLNDAGLDGMRITAANGSDLTVEVVSGNFSFANLNAINLDLQSGSTGTVNLNGAPASDNGQNGLLFNVVGGSTLTANVANSDFSRSGVNAIQGTVDTGSDVTLDLDAVQGTDSGLDGMLFRVQNSSTLTASGSGGSFNNSGNHGIRGILENGSTASLDFDGLTASNAQADGLFVTGSNGSTFDGIFTNGSFANAGLNLASPNRNAVEISMDNSVGTLNLTNTAGNNNGQNGLLMTAQNAGVINATVVNGNFNDSPINAIQSNVSGLNSATTLTMTNTTGNNSGLDGIRFNASNNGQFTANVTGGSFNNAGDSGIRGVLDNSATASLTFNNVNVNNANDDGLLVSSTNGSTFTGNFTGGSLANAGQDAGSLNRNAIELLVNNSTNTLIMTNTLGNNAGADGLNFEVNNGGSLTASITGGSFADAGSNAVDGFTTGVGTVANVSLDGTAANNADSTGILLNAEAGSVQTVGFANASVSNSGEHGVQVTANGAGTVATLNLTNATVDANGVTGFVPRDGVNLNATAGAQIDVNLAQGTISGNRDNGIRASVAGAGSAINMTGVGTSVTNNRRGDGLGFDVTTGGSLTGNFTGGSFSSNGTVIAASGVEGSVNGFGSTADLTFDGTAVDNNRADGFTMTSLNSGSLTLNLNNGVSASNNLGYGVNFVVDGPNTVGDLLMTGDNIISNNGLGGIQFTASNGAQTTSAISGNVSNNGGAGVNYSGSNLTINSLSFTGIFSNNNGQGINVDLNNSTVNALTVIDSQVNNNADQGVRIAAAAGSHINNGLISNNTINNNTSDGILFSLANSDATLFAIDSNLQINDNGGSGVNVVLNNAPTTDFAVTNNGGINGNGANGVVFDLTNSDLTDVQVDSNAISGNTLAGLQFNTATSNVSGAITDNVISNNLLSGIGINATGGLPVTTIDFGNTGVGHIISGNTINNNGTAGVGAGILANLGQNVQFTGTIQDNTISENQSFGVGITSTDGTVDLTMGGATAADGNTLDQNLGAGLALNLQNGSTGTVDIQNNTITGTLNSNPVDPNYQGDGINIRLSSTNILNPSTAQLTASIISNNTIGDATDATLGNAGRGIVISNDGNSLVDNLTMDQNIVSNNGGDGIQISKQDDANMTNVAITNSDLNDNGGDGLQIVVANGNQTTTFNVADNLIDNNAGAGIHLEVQADSKIDADLTNNVISNNTGDGVLVTEQFNDPSDQRDVTGVWIQNQIIDNGGNGINLTGAYGNTTALVIGQNGFDGFGNTLGNTISGNTGFGIASDAPGTAIITNNTITDNDAGGVQVFANLATANIITLDENLIGLNGGDGLELRATDTAFLSVTATGNSIVGNTGRGVDSLNQVNATTFLQFGDGTVLGGNLISANDGEGFYVVNTSSGNQTQSGLASDALLADGLTTVSPDMVIDLQYNSITNNGSPGAFSSAGLILRVGTSNSAGFDLNDNGSAGVGNAGLVGNGRVNARVTNNEFGGNFGSDVLIESFNSTVGPQDTVGTWNDTQFVVNTFERDPLARLNMVFQNNVGDALDVTRTGAFYNNAEGEFKSRNGHTFPVPSGPFTQAARRRNAQRLSSNSGPYAAPSFPAGAVGFAYDGVGSSTFQIESNFDTAGFTGGDTFAGDFGAVPPVANANGEPMAGALPGEELPFGWNTSVAPGTFQFLIP